LGRAPIAIVAPAFPEAGRTTVDGHVFVDGRPLEDTEVWRREALTGPADLRALLRGAGLKVELAELEQIGLASEALEAKFARSLDGNCDAIVCDALTEDDLIAVATACLGLPDRPLWVGSAGLMRALVRAEHPRAVARSERPQRLSGKPILTVVGSASGVSRMQFDALSQEAGIVCLTIPPSALRTSAGADQMLEHVHALDQALASGADVAVTIAADEVSLHEGAQLAAALAGFIAPRLSQVGGLVVTGGETARSVLVKAGVTGLKMKGEIEPGVPFGLSVGEIEFPVVTKAGAFGDGSTLVRCHWAFESHTNGHSDSA
jgi:D-threonate/D-erythronate kinase